MNIKKNKMLLDLLESIVNTDNSENFNFNLKNVESTAIQYFFITI